jgi:predicted ATPase
LSFSADQTKVKQREKLDRHLKKVLNLKQTGKNALNKHVKSKKGIYLWEEVDQFNAYF